MLLSERLFSDIGVANVLPHIKNRSGSKYYGQSFETGVVVGLIRITV